MLPCFSELDSADVVKLEDGTAYRWILKMKLQLFFSQNNLF